MRNFSNLNSGPISGFSALLYVNFIIKKKYRVDVMAKEMQIATDTLYRYIRGEKTMPPDRIIDLINATKDVEYLEFFCEPTGYLPVAKAKDKLCEASREKEEIALSILNGRAIETIEKAFKDGVLSRKEYAEVHRRLSELQRVSAELDHKIRKAL